MQKIEYKQIAELVNASTREVIGEEATILNEDLSNTVDYGVEIDSMGKKGDLLENLVGRIARVIMYDRAYGIKTDLGIYRDNITYGLTVQRLSVDELPEAIDNISRELQDGMSVDPFQLRLPKANAKYFEKRNTFEIDMSILDNQWNTVFASASELSRFVGMVFNSIENSKAIKINSLIMGVLRSAMSANIYANKQVKLITGYNTFHGYTSSDAGYIDPSNSDSALTNREFWRYMSMTINDYYRAISEMSTLYNLEGVPRFTPEDRKKLAVLGKANDAMQYYLEADTYHNNLVSLKGNYSVVDSWQNTPSRSFDKLSEIDVTNADGNRVQKGGIVACLYDADGLAITVEQSTVGAQRNEKGRYTNYFNFIDWAAACFKDMPFVVFTLE